MSKEYALIPDGTDPRIAQFVRSLADEASAKAARDVLATTALVNEVKERNLVIYRRVRVSRDRVDLYRAGETLPTVGEVVGVDIILEPKTDDRAVRVSELYERFSQEGRPGDVQP